MDLGMIESIGASAEAVEVGQVDEGITWTDRIWR